MEKNNGVLEDVLLFDPISNKGREALKRISQNLSEVSVSYDEFFSEVYVEPFFDNGSKIETKSEMYTDEEYMIYTDFAFSDLGTLTRNLKTRKDKYEDLFFSQDTNKLLLIRASSGSGKSIYLNRLKWKRRKDKYPNHINAELDEGRINEAYELNFDLEQSEARIQRGKASFPSEKNKINGNSYEVTSAPWRFFVMLIESIYNLSYSIIKDNNYKNCKKIRENFQIMYDGDHDDEVSLLYNMLKFKPFKFYNRNKLREVKTELLNNIIEICLKDPQNVECCIKIALITLTRLVVCQNNINEPEQLLISFDNIEHYIKSSNRVYDDDIKIITDSVLEFAKEEEKYYLKHKFKSFASYFKFVLVVRDTTDKMFSEDVHSYFTHKDRSIDITNWFPLEQIYNKKMKYCIPKNEDETEQELPSSIKFINLMITDSLKTIGNNIMSTVSTMYNHNNRRSTRIFTRISRVFDQKDENPPVNYNSINYEQFSKLWNWRSKSKVKNLCRQAVIRLIFNEIEDKYYFKRIHDNLAAERNVQNTYASRLLIWLSNIQNSKNEDYVSLREVAEAILCLPGTTDESGKINIDKNEVEKLSEVLIALDEHRFSTSDNVQNDDCITGNCWCQLIVIKFNELSSSGNLSKELLSKKIIEACSDKDVSINDYGIKITEAGRFFAKALHDFEYFACRYSKNKTPLIFMLDVNEIEKTIETVYNSAKSYIDNIVWFESLFFKQCYELAYKNEYHMKYISKSNNIEYRSLPYRIIKQHTYYLNTYRTYIEDDILHSHIGLFSEEDRGSIKVCIRKYIEEYNNILNSIMESTYKVDEELVEKYILFKGK